MALRFFPRHRQFWFYHLGASAFCVAVTLLTIALWSPLVSQDSVATVAWLLPYTLAVLGFRWLYKQRGWQALSMGRLIGLVFVYGSATAVLVAVVVAALTLPFFWNELLAWYAAQGATFEPGTYLLRTLSGTSLQAQVFLCAWIFIYISYTGQRDARQQELANAQLQASLKEAQLRSLSNQLNPHFLFNSLNNIRFMIHEDAHRAEAMLVGLSEILRYSLEGDRRSKVTLGEEVGMIERYIAIAAVQLGERLRFTTDIPPQLLACMVPPLLLQMLVENAVKHGVEPLRGGGAILLSACQEENSLRFVVANDMPAAPGMQAGLGIGMGNVAARLQLLYGDAALQTVRTTPGRHEVALVIPKEAA